MSERCILCGAPLRPDRRWRIVRILSPRFPACSPPSEVSCYRGLAKRIGANPSDAEVRAAVERAR